jgi:thiocyanate hydrolase subunit beta
MPSRSDLREYYNIGAQLAPMAHQHDDWPYEIGHPQYVAYMVPPHDVGGQADVPVVYEEKEEELWELNTYVTCEVLGWRGVWNAEERRRRGNNDLTSRRGHALQCDCGVQMQAVFCTGPSDMSFHCNPLRIT